MVQRQDDDRADCGYPCALNDVDVETSRRPVAAQKREKPTRDNRTDRANQDVNDCSLARCANHLACGQPEHGPEQNPDDHRHRTPMTGWVRVLLITTPTTAP